MESLGESGFDRARFGGEMPEDYSVDFSEVLTVLVNISNKSSIMVNELENACVAEMVNICAGQRIETVWDPDSTDTVVVSFSERKLTLSQQVACGLRDLIMASGLFRVYQRLGAPDFYDLRELIDGAWLLLAEELPQTLDYSTAADFDHLRVYPDSFWQNAAETDGPLVEERSAIHFKVA